MKLSRFPLVAVLVVLGVLGVAQGALGLAKFVQFSPSGFAAKDPIVNHHQAASAHDHMFIGSTRLLQLAAPESATYADLVGQGTLLSNPDDTAAYWIPTLAYTSGPNAGQPVPLKSTRVYYRCFNHDGVCGTGEKVEAYPPDMRMVAGNANQPAAEPLDIRVLNWMCDQRSTRPGPYPDIETARCDLAGGTVFLTAHVDFPTCWNGQMSDHDAVGDTSDNVHLRYPVKDACPAGFDRLLPELRMDVKWDYRGDGSDVALASDLVARAAGNPVRSGQTLHGDFWNTWVQTGGAHGGLVGMVANCVNRSPASWCQD